MASESDINERLKRDSGRIRRLLSSPRSLAAIGVAGVALAAVVWWQVGERSPVTQGMKALRKAYRVQRPFEARISGFEYAPAVTENGRIETDSRASDVAARLLLDADHDDPGPDSAHALGRFYLAKKDFDKAITKLGSALEVQPQNAAVLSDLAAALVEKTTSNQSWMESGEEIEKLFVALEHLDKALALDPDRPEPIFNRALLYQHLILPEQAREAWQQYIKIDSNSAWAAESNRYLKQLLDSAKQTPQTPEQLLESLRQAKQRKDGDHAWRIISENRDRQGSVVVRHLSGLLLDALSKGHQSDAQSVLEVLSFAANLEEERAGDLFTRDLISYYRKASATTLSRVIDARALVRLGIESLDAGRFDDARESFKQAQLLLSRAGNRGEAMLAEYLHSRCDRSKSAINRRLALYSTLSESSLRLRYKHLLTQIRMAQTQLYDGQSQYSDVIKYSSQGAELGQSLNDGTATATFLVQAATSYLALGNYHQSLRCHFAGLAVARSQPTSPHSRWGWYLSIGIPLNSLKRHQPALEYQSEALRLATALASPWRICRSHIYLGTTYIYRRDYRNALAHIERGLELANGIADQGFRQEHLALASFHQGSLFAQSGDFDRAAESYDRSIRLYEGLSTDQALRYAARKGKILALLSQGKHDSLEPEINETLRLFEAYRLKIREESNRNTFFDTEQSIYDVGIEFTQSRKNNATASFELAELSRARSLRDALTEVQPSVGTGAEPDILYKGYSRPLTAIEIQQRIPAQTQIVQYAVLEKRLLIWVLSATRPLRVKDVPVQRHELERLVSTYRRLVTQEPKDDGSQTRKASNELYRILIEPVESMLDKNKAICLVPDKVLSELPYSALIAPASGRYLIEDYSLVVAPSATMFVICSEGARAKERVRVERLLSVSEPAFDRKTFALTNLSSLYPDAESVAAYYDRPKILIREAATKTKVLDEIRSADVIHLATHYVVDEGSPLRSKMVLAVPERQRDDISESDSVLTAYEIYSLPLSRLRLVVLAACQTGVERHYGGEGMVGISRAFIARGIPLVVASLWEVDAVATSRLMIAFHKYRKVSGLPTQEALRKAQLDMLHASDLRHSYPFYWAAFECLGGYATF